MKNFTKLFLITFIIGFILILPTKKIFAQKQVPNASLESAVKPIGDFTNVKFNGEHQWGYSIKLWQKGDKIYGLISGDDNSRLFGDPPTGILENVQFDVLTNKFLFTAKLPKHKVFEFEGVLTKKNLKGTRIIIEEQCPNNCSEKKKIVLLNSKGSSSEMLEYQNYAEWKKYADKILAFRGPKDN